MTEQKHMRKVFAVIGDMDYQSEIFRYSIYELSLIDWDSGFEAQGRPVSRCGKYYYWQSGKFIVSDAIEIVIPYDPITTEDEVNWLQERIALEQSRSQQELEKKLDPLKARLTELLAITYQPTEAPSPEYEEEEEALFQGHPFFNPCEPEGDEE